jgi:hypothetical protein
MDTILYNPDNSIKVNIFNSPVRVFPNPTDGLINFETVFEGFSTYDLKILDIIGREIFEIKSITLNKYILDVFEFNPGIYVYEIRTKNQLIRGKFIKK